MEWQIEFSRAALKEAKKLKSANLESRVRELLQILKANPYEPPYEKLSGNLRGYYSRRINIKHRATFRPNVSHEIVQS